MTHAPRLLVVVVLGLLGRAALAAEHAPGDVVVDSGVRWIQRCSSEVLAFRTPGDAWLADGCGGLFRSHDGGHHWVELAPTAPPLSLQPANGPIDPRVHAIEWLDERIGLLFSDDVVLRTADGGQTWQSQPLAHLDYVTHVATTVWASDWDGKLVRSDDAGATWRDVATVPGGCGWLSFADRQHGWCQGTSRGPAALWQTSDGGASWHPMHIPAGVRFPTPLRLTRDVGWIYQDDVNPDTLVEKRTVHRTDDGGLHWRQVPTPPATAAVASELRLGGVLGVGAVRHRVTAAGPVRSLADLERLTPLPPSEQVDVLDAHTTARLDRGVVTWYRDGARIGAASSLLSPASGDLERLAGLLTPSNGKERWGWTERHFYRANGDGSGWFVVADTPEPFTRVILTDDDDIALARGRSGQLYESERCFFRWTATNDPMTMWRWTNLTTAGVPSPLACLAAGPGSLSLEVVAQGCFHHRKEALTLRWSGPGATLTTSRDDAVPAAVRPLPVAEARALVARIVGIVEPADAAPACGSTSHVGATLAWQCHDAAPGKAILGAPDCGDHDTGTMTGVTAGPHRPMHATLLEQLADTLVPPAPPKAAPRRPKPQPQP